MTSRTLLQLGFLALLFSGSFSLADDTKLQLVPDSDNQIIKLTDKGILPQTLNMKLSDSLVFLLNDSSDSLTTIEINFNGAHMHCNGDNLRADTDGKARSVRPFGPRDFAATCFHERGTYNYKVFGLKSDPAGLGGIVHVQ